MSKQFNGLRWEITPQPLSRLDYIATAIYAAMLVNPPDYTFDIATAAVKSALGLIHALDKEQNHE